MAVTVYRSSDPSAPVFDQTAGSLITLLDACLVNGYGAKLAAGWTKLFTGVNEAVYKMGAGGSDAVLGIKDSSTFGCTNDSTSRIIAAKSASAISTFDKPFPNASNLTSLLAPWGSSPCILKPNIGTTGADWIVIANARFFYLFTRRSCWTNAVGLNTAGHHYWAMFFFGDAVPLVAGDLAPAVLGCGISVDNPQNNTAMLSSTWHFPNSYSYSSAGGHPLCVAGGLRDGFVTNGVAMVPRFMGSDRVIDSSVSIQYPDRHYSGPIYSPVYLWHHSGVTNSYYADGPRFRMPGMYRNLIHTEGDSVNPPNGFPMSKDDTDYAFTSGELNGKTIKNLHLPGDSRNATAISSSWGFETTDGWGN